MKFHPMKTTRSLIVAAFAALSFAAIAFIAGLATVICGKSVLKEVQ